MQIDVLTELRQNPRREELDRLVPLVYDDLRKIAHHHLARRKPGGTLTTTAVVHEAYLKLVDQSRAEVRDSQHFLALASIAMRHLLVDRARARVTAKRGGGRQPISLEETKMAADEQAEGLLALDAALQQLSSVSPRLANVVEWRFFGGMTEQEIAGLLGVTVRTVERDWAKARMLLRQQLDADVQR